MSASSYDDVAAMYHALWSNAYLPGALPALTQLFFNKVEPHSHVLDLCCGSGHVTTELVARGFRVTGVDNSAALIQIARQSLPHVEFLVQDARQLRTKGRFDAALSTFDSLNHILSLEDLHAVFRGVYDSLAPGGRFVFDMNLEEAYSLDLNQWIVNFRPKALGLSRGVYDSVSHTAQTELIWFTQSGDKDCWHRQQSVVEERCYPKPDIIQALQFAGFHSVEAHHAIDLGVDKDLGFGRYFFSALK